MSQAINNLTKAFQHAFKNRPKVGGFPFLAETLRAAGVTRNIWQLPSCQSLYITHDGVVANQGTPLITDMVDVPSFDCEALIRALRIDQAGESTFEEFLNSAWLAGVTSYDVDFENRQVTYYGALGESYVEAYPGL